MPLARARCNTCTMPLGDPPHVPLAVRCARCGVGSTLLFAADGQPADLDVAFAPARLAQWLAAARVAMAHGALGMALGACKRESCGAPLTVGAHERVTLPCPHCGDPRSGAASEMLLDQWPEPWARVEGAGVDLEYRLAVLDDAGVTAGCAACGAPTPGDDPATRCRRCGAVTWLGTPTPPRNAPTPPEASVRRTQLGVRVNGTRGELPFNVVVPIVQGEAMLRADASLGASDRSGKTMLGFTGVGCAIVAALFVMLCGGVALGVYLAR